MFSIKLEIKKWFKLKVLIHFMISSCRTKREMMGQPPEIITTGNNKILMQRVRPHEVYEPCLIQCITKTPCITSSKILNFLQYVIIE